MSATRIACHEAGHAIVASVLGADIKHIEIGNLGGWTAVTLPADPASLALIHAAGCAAEQVGRYKPLDARPRGTDGERLRALLPVSGIRSESDALRFARSVIRAHADEWRALRRSLLTSYASATQEITRLDGAS